MIYISGHIDLFAYVNFPMKVLNELFNFTLVQKCPQCSLFSCWSCYLSGIGSFVTFVD